MSLLDKTIYGFHAVTAVLLAQPSHIVHITLATSRDDERAKQLIQLAQAHDIPLKRASMRDLTEQLKGISLHQGVVAKVHGQMQFDDQDLYRLVEHHLGLSRSLLLVACDNIQDPHNLGAIMRSAEAFGAHAVIAPKRNSAKLTPAARKVASGADASLPFIQVTNLSRCMDQLAQMGVWRVGMTEHAQEDLADIDFKGPIVIVMGSEGSGLRKNTQMHCDFLARIPLQGQTSSLNVSVAAGIALYQVQQSRLDA
jgi:23S rRNA (guanosine2251-2'-O)-methyltransferase